MRNDGFSPQKDVRRSTRERSTVYTTLHENNLGLNNGLIDQLIHKANQQHERELNERHSHQPGFTRSGRKIHSYYKGDDSTDDDVPIQRPSTRSRVYRDGVYEAIEESRKMHARELEQKKSKTDPPLKRRHVIDVEADSDGEMEDDPDVRNYSTSIYDHVKGERRLSSIENQATNDRSSPLPQSPNSSRRVRFARKARGADDEEKHCDIADLIREQPNVPLNGTSAGQAALKVKEKSDELLEEDEEDDEEVQEPRQYSLRVRRPPIQQPSQEMHRARYRDHSRESRRRRDDRSSRRSSSRNHPRRRRIVRSDSDSTGDEELFERRKERSMAKHRSRFMPINMTEKDLLNMESTLIKDRLRQTGGASCSDIDPMSIDQTLGFDQIGGLGQHIQSLKEVVIFPMLYPDVFSNFNIAPPKGVIFYGPPGTGKTMLARAIANECAQGVSKVAFFMRKGADCLSKWVGESERQLRLLFDQAYSMRPSIIFFDEIDGLAPVRSSKQDQIHASIVSTLLALMDGLDNRGDVVVIGATNRLDTLDPALRRPGRFDRELRFSLPDRNSRRQILDIHTSKWNENKPDEETLDWISGATSGYCGADIKQLCTESVLIALRSRYPQIYMTSERLALDVSSIKISKQHFETALQRITPASRRDLTIPSRPLDARTTIILGDVIEDLIVTRVPQGYQNTMALEAIASSVLEKVVRILEKPPVVPAVRLLLCGTEANANLGQTSFVLPAMLGRLDHLPVFSLSLSCLLKDSRPEEAISNVIISATRAASSGPCILLIPSIVEWEQIVPVSVVHLLTTFLDSLTGFTPILLLATLETSYEHSSEFVKSVFRPADCARFTPPHRSTRIRYFQHVLDNSLQLPSVFDASNYVMLPKASASEAAVVKRKLAENEVQGLKKMFSSLLRQLRIFLRDKLNRLIRDRRFSDFLMPVAIGDAADYYEIIENPMCLTDMMEKIDKREYNHADQFLDDIRLITMNALEYNPAITQDGRAIRHMAVGLRDVTEELFESELDESFIENLEAVSRLLQEAGVTPDDEKLIDMPAGFVRKSQWSITNSLKNEIAKWAKTRSKETAVASGTPTSSTLVQEPPKKAKKRRMGANGCSSRKRRLSKQIRDRNQTPEYLEDKGDEEEKDTDVIMNGMESDGIATDEDSNSVPLDEANGDKRVLMISQTDVAQLVDFCAETTEGWSVDDLERLAAEMLHQIEKFCDTWDRRSLLGDLEMVVKKWAMTSHAHS